MDTSSAESASPPGTAAVGSLPQLSPQGANRCSNLKKIVAERDEIRQNNLRGVSESAVLAKPDEIVSSVTFQELRSLDQVLSVDGVTVEQFEYGIYPWLQGSTLKGGANLMRDGKPLSRAQTYEELDFNFASSVSNAEQSIFALEKRAKMTAAEADAERQRIEAAKTRIAERDIPIVRVRVRANASDLLRLTREQNAYDSISNGEPALLPMDPASSKIIDEACTLSKAGN